MCSDRTVSCEHPREEAGTQWSGHRVLIGTRLIMLLHFTALKTSDLHSRICACPVFKLYDILCSQAPEGVTSHVLFRTPARAAVRSR